jgi:long-subunit fatty acid transport protein
MENNVNQPSRMNRNTAVTLAATALASGALVSLSAQAGGIALYEIGTPDIGLASAGYASRVQDASTVFRNPAGMSVLEGAQLQVGAQLTYGSGREVIAKQIFAQGEE